MFGNYDETLSIGVTLDAKDVDGTLNQLDRLFSVGTQAAQAFVGTLLAIDAAIIGVGVAASKKAAEFEALSMSLTAVEGSASAAKKAIEELRDIAKGPGLGVESAIQTYAGLRRGGLDSSFAMDLTRNLGNAIAYTGGGRDELSRVAIALNQIATSQYLRGQDVMQLNEARIPIYKILKDAFGTAETEDLKKQGIGAAEALRAINEQLALLPKVTGGAKNAFENIADALDYGLIQVGEGINKTIMPYVEDFSAALQKLNDSGSLKDFGEGIGEAFTSILDSFTGGAKDATEVLDDVMTSILTIAYASRNAVINVQNLFDLAKKLFPQAGIGLNLLGGGDSPYEEAMKTMEYVKFARAARETMKKAVSAGDVTAEEPATVASQQAVPILRSMDNKLGKMVERLDDVILGGGTATDRFFNARNISHMSGGHESGGWNLIKRGMEQLFADQMITGARAGNWRRSS